MYFKDKDSETEERCMADGIIYSIRTNGVLVFIPRYVTSHAETSKKSQLNYTVSNTNDILYITY